MSKVLGPFRVELRAPSERELKEAGERDGVSYPPYFDLLRSLERAQTVHVAWGKSWTHHPDERVRLMVLRRFGYFPGECHEQFEKHLEAEVEREREETGVLWNPLLDHWSLHRSSWRDRGAKRIESRVETREVARWLEEQKEWKELALLLRFRHPAVHRLLAAHGGVLGDSFVMDEKERAICQYWLGKNRNLTSQQAEHLFRVWGEEGWPRTNEEAEKQNALHGFQALLEGGYRAPAELRERHWQWMRPRLKGQGRSVAYSAREEGLEGVAERSRTEFAARMLAYDPETPAEWVEVLAEQENSRQELINPLFVHPNATYPARRALAFRLAYPNMLEKLLEMPESRDDLELYDWLLRNRKAEWVERMVRQAREEMMPRFVRPLLIWGIEEHLLPVLKKVPRLARGFTDEEVRELLSHPSGEVRLAMIAAMAERPQATERIVEEADPPRHSR